MENDEVILRAEGISKHFGGTKALSHVNLELKAGEVHALMGENGAGKSTLGKTIAGIHTPDEGKIFFQGGEVRFTNPKMAIEAGVSIVLQEFNLFPDLTVAENIFLADKFYFNGPVMASKKQIKQKYQELLSLFNMKSLSFDTKVSELSIAEMQMVEILKAVNTKAKIVIFDEPTATLTPNEVERLFKIINRLKSNGVGIIIVSHRIEEIYQIADRITVLRDGRNVLEGVKTSELKQNELIKAMVGREVNDLYGNSRKNIVPEDAPVVLEVKKLTDHKKFVRDVSFCLRKGEILGITGLVGAGRTELIRCIYGVDKISSGEIYFYGEKVSKHSMKNSIRHGISFIPEDRKNQGLILSMSILHNSSLVVLGKSRKQIISRQQECDSCEKMAKDLGIKMGHEQDKVSSLSGGNQQKVLLGKWLMTHSNIIIIDEPTRGVDILAKQEIYTIINNLRDSGAAILMVSSEMPEILGLSDRILIMRDGQMVAELTRDEADEQKIAYYDTISSAV